jgi:hypothetical protein
MCLSSKSSFRAVAARKPQQKLNDLRENDDNEQVRIWAGIVITLLEAGVPRDAPEKPESPNLDDLTKESCP